MTREEPKPNETARRAALLGMIVPAAALLGGCASRATTPAASAAAPTASPAIKGGLGAYALNPDGTRSFRDHELIDQDGKRVRFQTDLVAGRVFAATFMYVKCNGICRDLTARMREAHALLEPVMGNPVQFYTFSLAEDSPEDMKQYMATHGLDRLRGWRMLSGPSDAIRDIRWAFGFFEPNEELDTNLSAHTGMARFGNHRIDKWSACPALGAPEGIARGVIGVLPHHDRARITWFHEQHQRNGRPIPGWPST